MFRINSWLSRVVLVAVICTSLTSMTIADTFGSGENQFEIDFVNISGDNGDLGNWPAGTHFYSPSDYTFTGVNRSDYRIGKYEITNNQWDKFKNTVGSAFHSGMDDFTFPGANRPITAVSFVEAAQFVNWMNTSQGYQTAYKFTGTPGAGDYTVTAWDAADAANATGLRHKDAMYFIPTEEEWVKAAYWNGFELQNYATKSGETLHQGNGENGTGWNYFDFATGTPATEDMGPWDVGSGSEELNGTFDMMGNGSEFTESIFSDNAYFLVSRGGPANLDETFMSSQARLEQGINWENMGGSFRVAANVPEPMTMSMLALGGLGLIRKRRK